MEFSQGQKSLEQCEKKGDRDGRSGEWLVTSGESGEIVVDQPLPAGDGDCGVVEAEVHPYSVVTESVRKRLRRMGLQAELSGGRCRG